MTSPNSIVRLEVASRAEQVTLFEDRAEVKRKATVRVPSGLSWVCISGVGTMVDDASVIAGVRGERGRTLSTRVVRQVKGETAAGAAEIEKLEREVHGARAKAAKLELAIAAAEAELARCDRLHVGWEGAVGRVPRDAAESVTAARTARGDIGRAEVRSLDSWVQRQLELKRVRLAVSQIELRLQQGRAIVPRYEAVVETQVEATEAHEAELELTYRIPCALWRPEHLARLEDAEGGKRVALTTWATVWQSTGEVWSDVSCRFSTARPARAASAPLIADDVLSTRRKTAEERSTVVVEARDQDIALAGLERGTRDVGEMPGVDDGGEPLTFTALRPATIPSDGQPFRVELETIGLPATVDVIAYPERSSAAHLRATSTLKHRHPLLAGPVWLARGSELVGRGKLPFVAAGEPFEMGFGADDGLRVRRTLEETRDTVPVIGTQKVTRAVQVYVSNLSGSSRSLTVTERIPVSDIADLKVDLLSAEGSRPEKKDGFVRFDIEVPARGTRELRLKYRIEASAKVRLPF